MNIEVVLLQDDPKLGKRGEIVKVSSGFAQNFLFPQHKAKAATPNNLKIFKEVQIRHEREEAQRLGRAHELAAKMKDMVLTIEVSSGEGDKLYGSVNSQDVAQALAKSGFTIDRREVHLDEVIKKTGVYPVTIKLAVDVSVNIQVKVSGLKV